MFQLSPLTRTPVLDNLRACNLLRRNEFSILTNTIVVAIYSCSAFDLSLIDSATANRFWARQKTPWWDAAINLLGTIVKESICIKREKWVMSVSSRVKKQIILHCQGYNRGSIMKERRKLHGQLGSNKEECWICVISLKMSSTIWFLYILCLLLEILNIIVLF